MTRFVPLAAACLSAWLAVPTASAAPRQQPALPDPATKSAVVTPTTDAITIDGVLDEPIWRAAPTIGDLTQRQPEQGRPPTERTDVTLLYDRDHLYVGVVAYDSEPQRVIGTQMARDASLAADDRVEILLDTFRDQRSAFYFATNPSGALVDGLVAQRTVECRLGRHLGRAHQRTDQGWTAEFAIPFKSLSFPAGRTVWGFNIARHVYRKLEEDRWSGARLDTQLYQLSEAGEITNLAGLTQGIGLDVRPFLAGRWLRVQRRRRRQRKAGPRRVLQHHAQPEADRDLQHRLRRDGSRRAPDQPVALLGAVSGEALVLPAGRGCLQLCQHRAGAGGRHPSDRRRRVSVLQPADRSPRRAGSADRCRRQADRHRRPHRRRRAERAHRATCRIVVSEKNFFVGRVKRNLLQQSYVGAIFTGGHPADGQSGQTYGADMRLATSRFLGRPNNFVVNGYAAKSVNEGVPGRDWSYGFSAHYPNDKFNAQIAYREIQENFKPALGFVQRDNVRLFRVAGSYNPRPKNFLNVQQMFHDVYYTRFTRLDNGEVESWDLYVTLLDWHLNSGDNLHGMFDFNPTYERLFEPFEISPGVFLLPGEYRFTRFRSNLLSTATKRRLSGSVNLTYGGYWSGKAEQVTTSLTYKVPPRFTVTVSTNQTFARLPEGHFIARIFTSNVELRGDAAAVAVEPDPVRQPIPEPGLAEPRPLDAAARQRSVLRVQPGLDPGRDGGSLRFRTQDSKVSAKFQYSFRF